MPPGLFSAGFYYKTFMAPAAAWKSFYEPFIRRAAGLGVAPTAPDPDHYAQQYAFCDVLVVGAGAAGLAAALAAGETGASVILADEQAEMGGGLLDEGSAVIDGVAAPDWVASALTRLRSMANVTLLPRTQAFGYYAQNFLGLAERVADHLAAPSPKAPRERLWKVRAGRVVLACGAIERPLVFPDNDRPGVMLASAARTYLNRYGARPGKLAVIFAADDFGYGVALDLHRAGMEIAAIADIRPAPAGPGHVLARAAGLRILPATVVTGASGRARVCSAQLGALGADGAVTPGPRVGCDLVLMAGGWTPAVHLFSQSRGKLDFDAQREIYVPGASAQAEKSVGACNGTFDLAAALAEGHRAGAAAAGAPSERAFAVSGAIAPSGGFHGAVPHARDPQKVKAFVDFQNDVTAKDIKLAVREGMRSIEHVKRYTTTGMATDQGKTSNMNGLAIAAGALDRSIPAGRPDDVPPALHAGDVRDSSPGIRAGICSIRSGARPCTLSASPGGGVRGRRSMEARALLSKVGRADARRGHYNAWRCARTPAFSTPRRSARSRSSALTRPSSWSGSTPTRGPSSPSGAAATA